MLTVDYDRLGVGPGDRLLDLGAGFGRHAFEAVRRGVQAVAVDLAAGELRSCTATFAAMVDAGEIPDGTSATATQASALQLPFATGAFDRVIASEVLEHIDDDVAALAELARVLRPGGTLAVTVPGWLSEVVCWKLSDDYPAPAAPGGHVRIYTAVVLRNRLEAAGFDLLGIGHAHGLHTPYWWLRCAVGVRREDHPLVRAYHRLLVWDITRRPVLTRAADRLLSPVLGKSIVLYARRLPTAGRSTDGHDDNDGERGPGAIDVAA